MLASFPRLTALLALLAFLPACGSVKNLLRDSDSLGSLMGDSDARPLALYEPRPNMPTVENVVAINIHFTDASPAELDLLAGTGVRWVRMDLNWEATERVPGQYDFSAYDRLISSLSQRGIGAILILAYHNRAYDAGRMRDPNTHAAFARWAATAAQRYANARPIFEIWNEPDKHWPGGRNVDQYMALVNATSPAIRAAAPTVPLYAPATSAEGYDFLQRCLQRGLLNHVSGVTIHPYRNDPPETFASTLARIRGMVAQHSGGREVPVIVGEWGYSSTTDGVSEARQARYLARMMLSNMALGVPQTVWYDWHDRPGTVKGDQAGYQIVRPSRQDRRDLRHAPVGSYALEPKPAYYALRTMMQTLAGSQFAQRVRARSDRDYILVFRRGGQTLYAVWTTDRPHAVVVPGSPVPLRAISMTGQMLPPPQATPEGLVVGISGDPVYLVP